MIINNINTNTEYIDNTFKKLTRSGNIRIHFFTLDILILKQMWSVFINNDNYIHIIAFYFKYQLMYYLN